MRNTKALKEQHTKIKDELDQMLDVCEMEERALTEEENSVYAEKEKELKSLENTIQKLEKREGTKSMSNVNTLSMEQREHEVKVINDFIRGIDSEEARAITTATQGKIIPTNISKEIIKKLEEVAPLFAMTRKLETSAGLTKVLKEAGIGKAGFVGEMTTLSKEDYQLDEVLLDQKRCGAAVEVSQHLINQADIDILGYSEDVLYRRLGYALDRTVVNGLVADNQFEGLVNAPSSCDVTINLSAEMNVLVDSFIDAVEDLHPEVQKDAVWVMNKETKKVLAKLKDKQGNYLMIRENNISTGKVQNTFLGLPIYINDAVGGKGYETTKAYLVDFNRALACSIKKDVEFFKIDSDTTNRMRGAVTLGLDMYTDVKIVCEDAIKVFKTA